MSSGSTSKHTREPQRLTWQGTGGRLVVSCDGSRISLVAAQPDAGFKVEVGHEGSVRIEAEFEGREDQDGEGSHVRSECVSGVPEFDVETRGEENDE